MNGILKASEASQRGDARVLSGRIFRSSRRGIPTATSLVASLTGQSDTTTMTPKSRPKSKRRLQAEAGDLFSMVKVGWGLATMLRVYNEKQLEKGLPTVEDINDVRILELVEERRKTQKKNTHNYQVRMSKLASLGDIDAARKLKWSEQRIAALELWVRDGKIGQFKDTKKEESDEDEVSGEMSDSEYESESQYEFEPQREPKRNIKLEMEDNIQVAGLPYNAWNGGAPSMKTPAEVPIDKSENADDFMNLRFNDNGMWGYEEVMSSGPPASLAQTNNIGFGADAFGGSDARVRSQLANTSKPNSAILRSRNPPQAKRERGNTAFPLDNDDATNFLNSHTMQNYFDAGFNGTPNYTSFPDPFADPQQEHDRFVLEQAVHARQVEANAAYDARYAAQKQVEQADRNLVEARQLLTRHGRNPSLAGGYSMQ